MGHKYIKALIKFSKEDEYQKDLKNKINTNDKRKGWRCKICGFIYEHEILPPNYICPICKHGAIDFEKIS